MPAFRPSILRALILPAAACPLLAAATSMAGGADAVNAAEAPDAAPACAPCQEHIYFDTLDAHGRLTGGRILIDVTRLDRAALDLRSLPPAPWSTIVDHGPPSNRVDIVLVGDGYTSADLPLYQQHASVAAAALLAQPPFSYYQNYFNIHRVDVVSNESGVDNDPSQGIQRDTALDMAFWCSGIQRLLCVNVSKAQSYAFNVPQTEQIFAIANSTTYGGAGYPTSDLATLAGGNGSAAEIAIHEFGHSLGDLADEYDYGGPETYSGPELSPANVSILTAAAMLSAGAKWADWLGDPAGTFDGPVNTFEGANYSVFGVYRPSPNSKMRSLNRPFNAPSAEALIINIYRSVRPIDSSTPPGTLTRHDTAFVDTVDPGLSIQWLLNGAPIPGANLPTLSLASLQSPPGSYTLAVRVVDTNPLVRDEAARTQWMTQSVSWTLQLTSPSGDLNGDGFVGAPDLAILLGNWGSASFLADLNGDDIVNTFDLSLLLGAWGAVP